MNTPSRGVGLTVVAGATGTPTHTFNSGAAEALLSVGSDGDWKIFAPGVQPTHLYFTFDGMQLQVAAASEDAGVLVRGLRVGTQWSRVFMPSEIHFGGACILALAAEPSESRVSAEQPVVSESQKDDDDDGITLFRDPLTPSAAISAELGSEMDHLARQSRPAASEHLGLAADAAAVADGISETVPPGDFESEPPTCYDGGALRQKAAQLAQVTPSGSCSASAELVKAADPRADVGVSPKTQQDTAGVQARHSEIHGLVGRAVASWRRASRVQRAIGVLSTAVLCAALWSPDSNARARASPVQMVATAGSTNVAWSQAPRSISGLAVGSAAASLLALPRASSRPSDASNANDDKPRSVTSDPTRQRDAFNAARAGRLAEAAEMYLQLAKTSNSDVFSKAAHLARSNAVHGH